jgi:hypothetical protein
MKTHLLTPWALALSTLSGLHSNAQAQSNNELLLELQNLKTRMQSLEGQLRTQLKDARNSSPTVDPEEFNRIRAKVEATEDNTETYGFKGLKISGMIDPTYVYNLRQNSSGFVFLNNFDGRGNSNLGNAKDGYAYDNSYFGMAVLDLQKETENAQKWRLTLAPHKSASSGYNLGSIVHEASVSLPIDGPNTRVIAGQIPDWTGYEAFFSNQQPLISHNLLFDFTIPSFYSGAGMEFTRGKWVSKFILGNINQARRTDFNNQDLRGYSKSPGLSFRADYAKSEFNGFGIAGSHTTGRNTKVTQGAIDGFFTRGDLTFQGQIGAGKVEGQASNVDSQGNALNAQWSALSGLMGYKVTPRLQLVARADYIWNSRNGGGLWGAYGDNSGPDGRNGVGLPMAFNGSSWATSGLRGVNRYALSLGANYQISARHTPNSGAWNTGTWFKTELRYDGATGPVFLDSRDNSYKKNNLMLATSLVFAF